MSVLTLGPEGTFSHEAAKKLFPKKKYAFGNTIDEVFYRFAEKEFSQAVVPLENTISGFVEETITNLMKYDFSITGKTHLKVTYHLAGRGKLEDAKVLYAQPHALKQCRLNIRKLCPDVKVVETSSNAHSALQLHADESGTVVALVSPFSIEHYQLPSLKDHLEDEEENTTYFYSLGKSPHKKTGKDVTSFLLFSEPMVTIEKQIRTLCEEKKIELLQLKDLLLQEGQTPLYFIEVKGHIESKDIATLFEALSDKFLIKHLGSYEGYNHS